MGEVRYIEEFRLTQDEHQKINRLLALSFSNYPDGRSYYIQLPAFRLIYQVEKEFYAHLAVEHRVVNNGGQILRIFGIADFCVAAAYRSKGVGKQLVAYLEQLGRAYKLDFLLAVTTENDYYHSLGFEQVDNACRWLMVKHHYSMGVICRQLGKSLMIKQLGKTSWQEGDLDLLGHIF